jgi:EmrB/QacA subfamily drug resistance transporter
MAPRRWQVLTAICTAVFLGAIDFYIVSIAVPDMLRSFGHVGIAEISWVINGYAVTFTAALLPAGGLADRFGRRRVFAAGLATFTFSALACAAAPSVPVLIAARCVQGIGAGTITPLALTLILPQFPAGRRGTAIGLWSATQSAAVAAGPSLGGLLVAAVGWRVVFAVQVPIGIAALAGVAWALDRDQRAESAARSPDLAGVLLLGAAIGLPSLAIEQSHAWGVLDWRTDVAFCAGIAAGAGFVRRALTVPVPVIDLDLLRNRLVRRANGVMVLAGLVMFALPVANVLFLTQVWGYSEARAGLAITPGPVIQTLAALAGGRLCNRYGPRRLAGPAAVLLGASTLTLALATSAQSRYWAVVFPALLCSSTAMGFLVTSLSAAVVGGVPAAQLASATSMSVTARAAGAVVSLAALALVLSAARGGTTTPLPYHIAWTAMAVVAALATIAALAGLGDRAPNPASERQTGGGSGCGRPSR